MTRQLDVLNYSRGNLAHPTTLVIDRAGTVRFAHIDYDYTNRPAAEDLLAVLKALKE